MKNSIKKVALVIVSVCLLAITLCSCGQSTESELVGKWYMAEVYHGSVYMRILELVKDGTLYISVDSDEVEGYWSLQNETTLTIASDGDAYSYDIVHLDNEKLVLNDGGGSLTFYRSYDAAINAAQ